MRVETCYKRVERREERIGQAVYQKGTAGKDNLHTKQACRGSPGSLFSIETPQAMQKREREGENTGERPVYRENEIWLVERVRYGSPPPPPLLPEFQQSQQHQCRAISFTATHRHFHRNQALTARLGNSVWTVGYGRKRCGGITLARRYIWLGYMMRRLPPDWEIWTYNVRVARRPQNVFLLITLSILNQTRKGRV